MTTIHSMPYQYSNTGGRTSEELPILVRLAREDAVRGRRARGAPGARADSAQRGIDPYGRKTL